ncbi:hypothetical protein CTheo_1055 [Ceratobasidium theobromae]|uniref:Uncharacterized protein n=1 Tax=Ceratobasidium theobromae TaxID=1582974 RepID=A0A5N5QV90_9AGAM|nr:hypothetical protein CTheo_1055 [Ceratobasidium theobromae]
MHSTMDRYFPTESPEAVAHAYIKDHLWHDPTITVDTIGRCAAYAALSRYVIGEDLYVPPRNPSELDYILKRYTTDVLHSLVSQARDSDLRTMLPKARQVAASSLNAVLRNSELCESLLVRHSPPENDIVVISRSQTPIEGPIPHSRGIRTA